MNKHRKTRDYNSDAPGPVRTPHYSNTITPRIPVRTRDILARQRKQGQK